MKKIYLTLLLVFLVILVGCSTVNHNNDSVILVKSNPNNNLNYEIYIPKNFEKNQQTNLVVMLHGCGQSGTIIEHETSWNYYADEYQFIVLYPSQIKDNHYNNCFNWYKSPFDTTGNNELVYIVDLIEAVKNIYNINKVFVHGLSAGGAMAVNLGVKYPEIIDGIGVYAGMPYKIASTSPEGRLAMAEGPNLTAEEINQNMINEHQRNYVIPIIIFQGDKDLTVNYKNAEAITDSFALYNDAVLFEDLKKTNGNTIYTHKVYKNNEINLVEYYLIQNQGHFWASQDLNPALISYLFWINR